MTNTVMTNQKLRQQNVNSITKDKRSAKIILGLKRLIAWRLDLSAENDVSQLKSHT